VSRHPAISSRIPHHVAESVGVLETGGYAPKRQCPRGVLKGTV
jgi:hypothetical protein